MSVVDRGSSTNKLFELDPMIVKQVISELLTKIAPNGANSLKEIHASLLRYEVSFFLASLLQVEDRVSMASGVEVRVPLLSTEVVEFLLPLSLENRISGIRPKDLLRKIAVGLLPEKVLVRGDKMGFPVPLGKWSASSTPSTVPAKILMSLKEHKRAFVKTENVDSVMRKGGLGERGLWSLLLLESWYQAN
jgi:asparagine synthase (glutamine-hydrolysing)